MSELTQNPLLAIVLYKRKLKEAIKPLTSTDIEGIIAKLTEALNAKRDEESLIEQENAARRETLETIKQLLSEHDLTADDLLEAGFVKKSKSAKPPKPPKYEFDNGLGNVVTWNGAGRMPKAIKSALESGKSLEDLLIK
jgi:DNA-binding protein H-NS